MKNDLPVTIKRLDYAPAAHRVESIDLTLELDPVATTVTAVSQVRRTEGVAAAPLRFDAVGLTVLEVAIDGTPLAADQYRVADEQLVIDSVPERFVLRVVNRIDPTANTALLGLFVSNGNFYTQCEAEGFRRITCFPDRPDVMARFVVTLIGDRERLPVLLSNGNLIDQGDWAAGADGRARHYARWEDPFVKPSYLFAVVAGRLQVSEQTLRTCSGREVLLQIWVEPGNQDKTGHAMRSLVRSIRWDEERFGLELDLDRFMIVAVGDFNMGAMENKGLNIFNTKYVFAHPRISTDADFAAVEAVVGHEYFHNWTGNRVTCRDWFQLTLKEGLTVFRDQEFSADMLAAEASSPLAAASSRAVKRIEDVRNLRATQFPEDAGPMAHPIRPNAYQEINNFYTMTVYEKGAEVVRMLQTLVGRDGFRRGMDLYFKRHDGHAVTCDDFVAAIADANGRDLTQFGRWYSQAGTPRLIVQGRHDAAAGTYTLEVEQKLSGLDGPLHIPLTVGLVAQDGQDLPLRLAGEASEPSSAGTLHGARSRVLELTQSRQSFVFGGVSSPPTPSLGRDFSAPVIIEFAYSERDLAFLAAHDADPFNRWEASQRLAISTLLKGLSGTPAAQTSATLAQAWAGALADETLDPAYRELMMAMPGEGVIAEQIPVVDPDAVRAVRRQLATHLGLQLAHAWSAVHRQFEPAQAYEPSAAQSGRRALRNLALWYWSMSGAPEAWAAAARQFDTSDNMSARQGALAALLMAHAPQAEPALERFATELADEPLAMDKWFMMQATQHRAPQGPPVLEHVRRLLSHPSFSMRNPNKVRSLIGGFCLGNLAEFHHVDGSGYRFWEEMIGELDPLNPQIASRIARAMERWRKFTPDRQVLARATLERVAGRAQLSRDVREIIGKALASG
ncbi:MAG TPA: aminopeptidase N [Burkholderiaceae bacterium]|nr:aminopeptidase N [Burkholderiaceae bacterium]